VSSAEFVPTKCPLSKEFLMNAKRNATDEQTPEPEPAEAAPEPANPRWDALEAEVAERHAQAVANVQRSDSDTAIRRANAGLPAEV
jgi:hypothetical protein